MRSAPTPGLEGAAAAAAKSALRSAVIVAAWVETVPESCATFESMVDCDAAVDDVMVAIAVDVDAAIADIAACVAVACAVACAAIEPASCWIAAAAEACAIT